MWILCELQQKILCVKYRRSRFVSLSLSPLPPRVSRAFSLSLLFLPPSRCCDTVESCVEYSCSHLDYSSIVFIGCHEVAAFSLFILLYRFFCVSSHATRVHMKTRGSKCNSGTTSQIVSRIEEESQLFGANFFEIIVWNLSHANSHGSNCNPIKSKNVKWCDDGPLRQLDSLLEIRFYYHFACFILTPMDFDSFSQIFVKHLL